MRGYRENYSTNHILLKLVRCRKKALDEKLTAGTVFIQFSKALDCVPNDLLISKPYAYGLSQETVTFIQSYLKRR